MSNIVIDTRLRQPQSQIYDAKIDFRTRGLKGRYKLKSFNIFNSFTNVNSTNNLFHFDTGSGLNTLVIPDGSYSITSLTSTIRNNLATITGFTWSISLNPVSYRISITCSSPVSVDFSQPMSIGFDLGYNKQVYNITSIPTIAENLIRLSLFPLAYYIKIKEASFQDFEASDSNSFNFVIPITTALQSQNYYESSQGNEQYIYFDKECKTITVQLYDQDNNFIKLFSDYYFILDKVCDTEY